MQNKKKHNRLIIFLKDKRKKSFFKILKEATYLLFSRKEIPFYYFKYLYRKDIHNFKDYLTTKEGNKIQHAYTLHKEEHLTIISNKLNSSLFFNKNGLPVPKLIGYNFRGHYLFNDTLYIIKDLEELRAYFNTVFSQKKITAIFIKPLSEYGGKGCIRINQDNLETIISTNKNDLLNNSFIHESIISQHQEVNKIFSNCINSIRFLTYVDKFSKPQIIVAYMRFGVGKSVVDNVSSGGFQVGINLDTGELRETGYQDMEYGGANYKVHPDTKFNFKGFKIPYFKEAYNLVIKATNILPDRIIGWDIAISDIGPVIIEANEYPSIFAPDIIYGGLRKHPLMKEILKEAKTKK